MAFQTAFIALTGVLSRIMYSDESAPWFVVCFLSSFALLVVYLFSRMDHRARDYVDVIKGKLVLIEKEWGKKIPSRAFSTYTEQFEILVHKKEGRISQYAKARGLFDKDRLHLIHKGEATGAAHIIEARLFHFFALLWFSVFLAGLAAQVVTSKVSGCSAPLL